MNPIPSGVLVQVHCDKSTGRASSACAAVCNSSMNSQSSGLNWGTEEEPDNDGVCMSVSAGVSSGVVRAREGAGTGLKGATSGIAAICASRPAGTLNWFSGSRRSDGRKISSSEFQNGAGSYWP